MYKYIPTNLLGPPITINDIEKIEERAGLALPSDYKSFLLEYNGGSFDNAFFEYKVNSNQNWKWDNHSLISMLYGIRHSHLEYRLDIEIEDAKERMPEGFFVIGDDPYGNRICLCLSQENYGKVYFWNHDLETEPPTYENCFLIANSFTEFMESLKPYEEE